MADYFVRSSGGSDGNTGLSFAQGWATIQYALDTVNTEGDRILICADGNHLPTAQIDIDTNAIDDDDPIIILSANATGTIDGTQATISGASLPANTTMFSYNLTGFSYKWENLRITGATDHNILFTSTANGHASYIDCRIDSATDHGVRIEESDSDFNVNFINCEVDSNGAGIGVNTNQRGGTKVINCSIHDNTNIGYAEGARWGKVVAIGNLIYDNGGDGIKLYYPSVSAVIMGNVIFGNSGDGLDSDNNVISGHFMIINNIFRSNGGYGINTNTATNNIFAFADYNCYSNNTSGAIDIGGGTPPGSNNVTSDPQFVSETDGSEDFTLQSGSPCLDVGFGYDG